MSSDTRPTIVVVGASGYLGRRVAALACSDYQVLATYHAHPRPDDAGAFTLLGRVRAMQGRFPEAAAALQRALQLAPGDPEASAYLARLRELGGR